MPHNGLNGNYGPPPLEPPPLPLLKRGLILPAHAA